jgi:pimeloyl-ACP methyl ester carboxylesterase
VATTHANHAPVEARLEAVKAHTLVVMGDRDPDFKDATAEAEFVADELGGVIVMVAGAGHYPHAEFPEIVTPAVLDFLGSAVGRA